MIFQDTFNIIVLLLLIFIIYKLSFERFSNLTTQDLESISNLSSMYDKGELKISKLHVTDDAQFDKKIISKKLHVTDDAQLDKKIISSGLENMAKNIKDITENLEGVQNISSMFDKGELKIGKLHVTDDAIFDKKIISSDLKNINKNLEGVKNISSMFDKGELKIGKLHVTDDAKFDKKIISSDLEGITKNLEGVQSISSMIDKGEFKVAKLHVTDDAQFDKNIKVNEKMTSKNLHVDDYSSTKRLDVRNNGTFSFTHFNYNNEGKNYYRGKNWIETNGTLNDPVQHNPIFNSDQTQVLKNFLNNDSGVKDNHISFVRINKSHRIGGGKLEHKNVPAMIHRGYTASANGIHHWMVNDWNRKKLLGKFDNLSLMADDNHFLFSNDIKPSQNSSSLVYKA